MNRETIIVPEKKEKIERIKKKYRNMSMSDNEAKKIKRLETINDILKTATAAAGVITIIDFFIPDPVLGLDEAALTALTGLFGYATNLVNNKIDSIANSNDMGMQMDEVNELTKQISNAAKSIKNSRSK